MRTLFLHPSRPLLRHLGPHLPFASMKTKHPGGEWDVLVRWGSYDGPDSPFTYNARWALENAAHSDTYRSLLRLNGIPMRERIRTHRRSPRRIVAKYRVHMVDLYAVAIRRIRHGVEEGVQSHPAQRRVILESLARRALYALGLHFGAVDIVVERSGKPAVSRVDPAPSVEAPLLEKYVQALAESIRTLMTDLSTAPKERSARLTLGADPEFIVVRRHNQSLRYASDLFPQHGAVGYDRQSSLVQGRRCHPIAEIRPAPALSPYALLTNLRNELERAYRMAPDRNADWLAGAYPGHGCFTGGHVHFSGIRPTTFLLRALDTYVAIPTLLIEDARKARARRPRYGYLGDFREKDHGGFEYRTLSSWISGMQRARSTLCLAKLVAVEYPRLLRHLLTNSASHEAFYQGDKDAFRGFADALWNDMRGTYSYKEYSQDLERTRIWILNRRQWRERVDLKRLWHIQ